MLNVLPRHALEYQFEEMLSFVGHVHETRPGFDAYSVDPPILGAALTHMLADNYPRSQGMIDFSNELHARQH